MTPVLAQRLRADRSFERMYKRHVGDVYRYALAVLRQPADAEDVTQTTFLNAYRAFERGERPRNAQNWLIAIAHNVCRQRFRQAQRRPEEVAFDDRVGDVVPDDESAGPSAEDIQRALGHLAFNQRAALVMRELEGRSYAEIAEILGISVSAVETLIFRARRALREQLEGTLTCLEAERAISRRADGKLSRQERSALRAHVRECRECERLARSQRAQRTAFKALAAVPLPTSLTSLFGGGGAAVGTGVAAKAAAVVAAGVVATGAGYKGAQELTQPKRKAVASQPAEAAAVAAPVVVARRAAPVVKAKPTRAAAAKPKPAAKPKQSANAHGRATAPGQLKKASVALAPRVAKAHKQKSTKKAKPARSRAHVPKPTPPGRAKKHETRPALKEHGKPPKP
ncbi:MAG TPA: sigma-70 family RNA polymerase sigma factor [Gaiellaceae bacterium]|nr:sigma-70 family RNA polymerase sigma factor [Gaiellaceae bacterium]